MRQTAKLSLPIFIVLAMAAGANPPPDYQEMLDRLHITSLRAGADGMNPSSPNAVNYDEQRVGHYTLPDPLRQQNGTAVTTKKAWWTKRRPEIVELFDREMYGRVPAKVPGIHWETQGRHPNGGNAVTEHLIGHVDNADDSAIRADIAMNLTLPQARGAVPVMIVLSWERAMPPVPAGQGPDWREQLLSAGWGYAELIPTTIQPDDPGGLRQGIIGLANKGAARTPEQWGALRAWAWGTSRAVDHLAADPRIDGNRIGVAGHSRYGKAALVAMAYDPRIAIGYISSSGAGGAKLLRRDYGERLENLAGTGEYHWMAGNFLKYAGPKATADLPVDAHELIALCAPRPLFIGTGTKEADDGWVDPRGMFLAAVAAGPVYRVLGERDLGATEMPPVGTALTEGKIGFRQHPFGHTPQPNWANFIAFAEAQLKR